MTYYFDPFWCTFLVVAIFALFGGAALADWLRK